MPVVSLKAGVEFILDVDGTRMDCPRCGTKDASLLTERKVSEDSFAQAPEAFLIARCGTCRQEVGLLVAHVPANDGRLHLRVVQVAPLSKRSTQISDVPENVAAALGEAELCAEAGALHAGALVCRRALELLAKDLKAGGKNLPSRIDSLPISSDFKEAAHAVRLIGNEAAHDEWESVSAQDLADLIEISVQIAEQAYTWPAKARRLRDRAAGTGP